ncbi:hypothetical protein JQ633_31410 [Bradyrhizobium tropiciagri]|uniref:hypothetical protein n=1 Tax=Bradyrhizobium tropiciagri TaxID=312253 RepID=UPI001BA6E4CB|nr:hypothetical protein [Bradyrhizobium tropiciagri]MBR0874902.1 hypothetical protein [Bradyrhizobium tropiciagri]
MSWRAGDWVEVRSREEILRTLDESGRLEGLPFMPQMLEYCGRRFQVYKRAHKTCDAPGTLGGLKLPHGIHLDLRCDGKAYGGCQAGCLLFWKEAWLRPVDAEARAEADEEFVAQFPPAGGCSESDVWRATKQPEQPTRYSCQATEVLDFARPLKWWDARQYAEDYLSGNTPVSTILTGFIYQTYYYGSGAFNRKWGEPARWLYDRFQSLWGGVPFPRRRGKIPAGSQTPLGESCIRAGDLVRVRPLEQILATLDTAGNNRGMHFDAELVPYCGKVFRVRTVVERFVDEKTGVMRTMKTPAVILEGVWCRSHYSSSKMFCPRSIYSWWREIWLERVIETPSLEAEDVTPADVVPTQEPYPALMRNAR